MGLLDGLLGSSFEDPRTAAVFQAAGLLGGAGSNAQRFAGAGQSMGIAMMQARQAEEEKRRRALQEQMLMQQLEAAKAQQAERAAAQATQQKDAGLMRNLLGMPVERDMPQGMQGPGEGMPNRGIDPRAFINQGGSMGGLGQAMQLSQALNPAPKLMSLTPGQSVVSSDDPTKALFTNPFKPEPQKLPALAELQQYRDSLPPGDPRRREVQGVIDNQTRAPKYATAAGPSADPTMGADPTQMALNLRFGKPPANRRWKQDGSLEVIPGSADDRKATEQTAGKETVDSVVASLRSSYDGLNKGGGITSTARGALENIPAAISRSAIGQVAGGIVGSQNQKERDAIAQARPLLLQAIMKATGMSAKQMDSNAELKLYLATATDPTLSLEANREALDRIEKLYGSGATGSKQRTVVRTGTLNGRKVVQYSDGSTDYAD